MTKEYRVRPLSVVFCPSCKNGEAHPRLKNSFGMPLILIKTHVRKDKYGRWWNHCLVCSRCFDKDLNPSLEPASKTKGWFIHSGDRE